RRQPPRPIRTTSRTARPPLGGSSIGECRTQRCRGRTPRSHLYQVQARLRSARRPTLTWGYRAAQSPAGLRQTCTPSVSDLLMTLFNERDEIFVPDEGPCTELEGGDLAVVYKLVERRPPNAKYLGGVADGIYKRFIQFHSLWT